MTQRLFCFLHCDRRCICVWDDPAAGSESPEAEFPMRKCSQRQMFERECTCVCVCEWDFNARHTVEHNREFQSLFLLLRVILQVNGALRLLDGLNSINKMII